MIRSHDAAPSEMKATELERAHEDDNGLRGGRILVVSQTLAENMLIDPQSKEKSLIMVRRCCTVRWNSREAGWLMVLVSWSLGTLRQRARDTWDI